MLAKALSHFAVCKLIEKTCLFPFLSVLEISLLCNMCVTTSHFCKIPSEFSFYILSLRQKGRQVSEYFFFNEILFACQLLTAGKKLFKKWLLVILNFSFIIPTPSLCQT